MNAPLPKRLVSIAEVARHLRDPRQLIIDARSHEEYDGWKLHGEARGGHIPGAIHLPFDASDAFLRARGATPEKRIVVIGDAARASKVIDALSRRGYPDVARLEGTMAEWAADPALPIDHLPGYRELVYPAWVSGLIAGERVPELDGREVVIAEVGWGGPQSSYDTGHIPGAIYVDTDEIEADETRSPRNCWKLLPHDELVAAIENMGITEETTVVVYGRETGGAARFVYALLCAGVRDVRLLSGGLEAWKRFGGPLERERVVRRSRRRFGAGASARREYRTSLEELRARLGDSRLVLADVRSTAEYSGASTGYAYIFAKGRIPGARFAHGGPDSRTLADYHGPDGMLRAYGEVEEMWRVEGIARHAETIFYCGTGWRASVAFLYARWMGFERASVFDGGWLEWSTNNLPRRRAAFACIAGGGA